LFKNQPAKRGPKTDPDAPHNKKIREVADQLESDGNTIIAGGGRLPERIIVTPGGIKGSKRPDIIYRTKDGESRGVNVGRTGADGLPVTREIEALNDLRGPGNFQMDPFVPYD
jgi:hypothetical protein